MASVGGVKVSMVAFQAVDPGSIPGRRMFYNVDFCPMYNLRYMERDDIIYVSLVCDM